METIRINHYPRKNNIYNFISDNLDLLINDSEYFWSNLQFNGKIESFELKTLIELLMEDLKELKSQYKIDIYSYLFPTINETTNYEEIIKEIFFQYTGSNYKRINVAFSSASPPILSKMKHLLNLLIPIFRNPKHKQLVDGSKEKLYRHILVDVEMLELLKENSFIFFTSLASCTKKEFIFQKKSTFEINVSIKFIIKVLDLKTQQENSFYSALYIDPWSRVQGEEEVLILPYVIFQIKKIKKVSDEDFDIYLDEVNDKRILNKLQKDFT